MRWRGSGWQPGSDASATAAVTVTIAQLDTDLELSWLHDSSLRSHEVCHDNGPDFSPGSGSAQLLDTLCQPASGDTVTYLHTGVGGDPAQNHCYLVRADDGAAYTLSNRVAAFNFSLEPGTPPPAPDLAIASGDGNSFAFPGEDLAYTITYSYTGTALATGVIITETLPADTTFNPAGSAAGCGPSARVFTYRG